MKRPICVICGLLLLALGVHAQEQQFANIGDLKLQNGGVIRYCRVGYRTFGTLNRDKSNVVVFPTWAGGTTEQLKGSIGPGKLVDSTSHFVVAIDALSNGVSSSPSNSRLQPRMRFPIFSLRDTVESQHELLTKVLKIDHVKAVVGISMGGMQAFQWIVSYPEFMDKAIPIVGSPRLAPFDLLLWQTENAAITSDPGWNNGDYTEQPALTLLTGLEGLAIETPEKFNQDTTREKLPEWFAQARKDIGEFDANNHIRQSQAMMALDVSAPFGGSMERAAAAVKAKVLVIASRTDHMVTPGPALDFARLLQAEVLELQDNCGHLAPGCETAKVGAAIAAFLEKP